MAAKGAQEKIEITQKILEMFDGAFTYDKEIRIPINGVEIKVALTCAKENVGSGSTITNAFDQVAGSDSEPAATAPTEDELATVRTFMEALGI